MAWDDGFGRDGVVSYAAGGCVAVRSSDHHTRQKSELCHSFLSTIV